MNSDPDCIFCRIVAGEIPSFKLLEDDRVLSFMDINPANEGHCLVIPKAHVPNLYEAEDESLAAVASACRRVADAVRRTLDPPGISIAQANGQSVLHLHFHIPRRADDDLLFNWELQPGDPTRSAAPSASAPTSVNASAPSRPAPLVSCPANTRRKTFEFAEDRFGRRDPDEGRGRGIVVRDELLDGLDQLGDAVERAARWPADEGEPGSTCQEAEVGVK